MHIDNIDFTLYDIELLENNISDIHTRYKNTKSLELNKYGVNKFCKFKIIANSDIMNQKGLYCYVLDNEVKYIGRCLDSFKKRFSGSGYGAISPRNCFKGGQATNCHINSLVNEYGNRVKIGLYAMNDNGLIKSEEIRLIKLINPCWNIQDNNKKCK